MNAEVVGVDGCRGGWAIVRWCARSRKLKFYLEESLSSFAQTHASVTTFVIDMPIHLAPEPERGGRTCDREARRYLGHPAGASLFSAPPSSTLVRFRQHKNYRELHEAQKKAFAGAPGLTKQTFHLLPKIDEVDLFERSHPTLCILEGHPEVAFKKRGLWQAQTFSPKKTLAGRTAREQWARACFGRLLRFLSVGDAAHVPILMIGLMRSSSQMLRHLTAMRRIAILERLDQPVKQRRGVSTIDLPSPTSRFVNARLSQNDFL